VLSMREAVNSAARDAHPQAREVFCPRCGLRLQLTSRVSGQCSVGYSIEKWSERCERLEFDSPLACLMSAPATRDLS
jgi:hypothetical protein